MFLSAMHFIIKIYPNIQLHLGAQPQVLKDTYDPFFPSDTSVCVSVMELVRNNDSEPY
jgi:hypothetical protein